MAALLTITVVTPSLNQGRFLERAIRSVLSQEYPKLEYVVVDGGSTDGSVEIIRRYENRLHAWISEPDDGQYDAIRKGLELGSGEIMAWINADDLYFPWALENGRVDHVRAATGAVADEPQHGRVGRCGPLRENRSHRWDTHETRSSTATTCPGGTSRAATGSSRSRPSGRATSGWPRAVRWTPS
jgi:hypothetical protein